MSWKLGKRLSEEGNDFETSGSEMPSNIQTEQDTLANSGGRSREPGIAVRGAEPCLEVDGSPWRAVLLLLADESQECPGCKE